MAEPEPISQPAAALRIDRACKRYGATVALDGLSLAVAPGEWLGLLGPNGAGKTTALLATAGLIRLDAGQIELLGREHRGPRPDAVGLVPQEVALYRQLTARENLSAFGRLHGLRGSTLADRLAWALEWTGLGPRADDRVERFSGGMLRRLNIACGVLHRPPLVLLDEPTVGVDPQARERIFTMLDELRRGGAALVHSTHELGDIEERCDRLAVMDRGRTIADGRLQEVIRDTVGCRATVVLELDRALTAAELDLELSVNGCRVTGGLDDVATELPRLLARVAASGATVERVDVRRPGLAEVFVALTGRGLRE
jgi:ABC-2 type transport system ATP-binding protein